VELWMTGEEGAGRSFLKAIVEYSDPAHPVYRAVREHDDDFRRIMIRLATEAGAGEAKQLADRLILLVSGAMVEGLLAGNAEPVRAAKAMAGIVLGEAGLNRRSQR
jgi:hypothetical protein